MSNALAVTGLLVLGLLATAAWRLYQRLRRSRLAAGARRILAGGAPLLAACRLPAIRNPAVALRIVRLTRAQRELGRHVADAMRTGAFLGDVPAMLPRLRVETERIRTGLGRLPSSSAHAGPELLAAADRHLATLTDLSDAVTTTLVLPAAEGTLSRDAEEAAHGLRLYTAAYAELTTCPTAGNAIKRMAA